VIGQTISHYRIVEKLGEGGMGVVYKAEDTKLGRTVALKFLAAHLLADPEHKARFLREGKAAAALDHPNIATIHEIDEAEGQTFLSMAYVEGASLDRKIKERPLKLDEALDIAIQAAQGLQAAHEKSIVHRDIKSANILLTHRNEVKITDFGLARFENRTQFTKTGLTLGTPAYMSPEQAMGQAVDRRSDIWSLGVVLYEMVAGRLPFGGEVEHAIVYNILNEEPEPVTALRSSVPRELDQVLSKVLAKDAAKRYQHVDELLVDLRQIRRQMEAEPSVKRAVHGKETSSRVPWAVAAGLVVVSLGIGVWLWTGSAPPPAPPRQGPLVRLTSDAGLATDPALSADGRLVAYASDRGAPSDAEGNLDIWVQQIAGGESLRLTSHAADEREPSFSPDGSRIAYRSEQDGGGIHVVSTLGGELRPIAREGRGPRFSPGGDFIAYWTGGSTFQGLIQGKAYIVPAAGGQPRQVQPEFHSVTKPLWSPDGQQILFLGARDAADIPSLVREMDWWITPLDGDRDSAVKTGVFAALREQKFLFGGAGGDWVTGGIWLPGPAGESRILFSARAGDARNIWRIPIDDRTWRVTGVPERLTFGAAAERAPAAAWLPGGGVRLVFASLSENFDIWSLPLDANRAVVQGPMRRLTEGEDADIRLSLSLDGNKLAYLRDASGRFSIRVKDLSTGRETTLGTGGNPLISQDGSKVAHIVPDNKMQVVPTTGGEPELVCEDCFIPTSWSSDGTKLLDEQVAGQPLGLVVPGRRQRIPVLRHASHALSMGRFSPDDRWIAFHAIPDPTTRQVFIAPFRDVSQPGVSPPEEKEWIPITDGKGMERYASWSPDGNVLYFLSEQDGFRCLRAQRLDPATKRPVGPPIDVSHFHQARRSLLAAGDPINVNPCVAVDKVAVGLPETTGNIWMTDLEAGAR
jgi:Tol biopolymer transport system component